MNISRWRPATNSWSALGAGIDGPVHAVSELPGLPGELLAGGTFVMASGGVAPNLARWACPPPACLADCDASGGLSIDDFICFQTFFVLGDAKADCDASGTLTIDDFVCFQTAFVLGC